MKESLRHIALFVGLVFLTTIMASILLKFLGKEVDIENVSPSGYMLSGALTQIVIFTGSFILYLLVTGQKYNEVLWLSKVNKAWVQKTILILIGSYIAAGLLGYINSLVETLIPENSLVQYSQKVSQLQTDILGSFKSYRIIYPVFVVGILTAIGEELVFRGFLLKKVYDIGQNRNVAIVMSALIFAVVHFQILNFLPIFFMGLVLGYVYFESKNIIYPMIIHCLFNSIQVLLIQYI